MRFRYRTIVELFEQSMSRTELVDKNYLEVVRGEREEALTFGQLRERSLAFAAYLIESEDIRQGDKVAVVGRNRADWDVALWGIVLAGGVPVLVDPDRRVDGVKKHLVHTDVKLLVLADDYQDKNSREELRDFIRRRGGGFVEMTVYDKPGLDDGRAASLPAELHAGIEADATAVILCTSGTTGEPREV